MISNDYLILPPDWGAGVKLSRAYRTRLLTTITDKEQRGALRSWPIKKLEYRIGCTTAEETARLQRILHTYTGRVIGVPLFVDRSVLTAQASSGAQVVTVDDTDNRHYEEKGPIILTDVDHENYEVVNLTAGGIAPTALSFTETLASTWPIGTYCYPLLQARLSKSVKPSVAVDRYADFTMTAEEEMDPVVNRDYSGSISGFPTLLGWPILNLQPNYMNPFNMEYKRTIDIFDGGLGMIEALSLQNEARQEYSFGLRFYSREDIWEFLNFFDYMKGRHGVFWSPSWLQDLELDATVGPTDVTLTVKDYGYPTYWGTIIGKYVMFRLEDGTLLYRTITGSTATTITIDTALGVAITAYQINRTMISFLGLGRFVLDEIDVDYHAMDIADINHGFSFHTQQSFALEQLTSTSTTTTSTTTTTTTS